MNPSVAPHYRRNFILIIADYVLFGLGLNLLGPSTVLPEFVRHLTSSAPLIGLVLAVWNGAWLIPQLIAAQTLAHRVYKKPMLVAAGAIGRPAFLAITLALVTGVWRQPGLMILLILGVFLFFWIADAFCSIAWFDILAKIIPAERRGRLFGVAQVISGLVALGVAAFVAYMLGPAGPPYPYNYAWLFGLASAATLIGLIALALLVEPPESAPQEELGWRAYLIQLRALLRDGAGFRRVIGARLLDGLSTMATPFFIVYATEVLGYGPETIGVFIAAQTIGGMASSLILGGLAERLGTGRIIRAAVIANISGPLVALLTYPLRGATWLWLPYAWVFVVMGIASSAMMLGWMNYVLEMAPPGQRPTYTGLTNTLTGLLIPMPVLGGWLLQFTSYPVLFVAAAAGPLLALVLALRLPAVPSASLADRPA